MACTRSINEVLISYDLTLGAIIVGTLGPAYLSLYLIPRLKSINTWYLAALGVGLTFWFFIDTMGDADYLEVNSAIYPFSLFGGAGHFALIATFAAGIAALAIIDHYAVRSPLVRETMQVQTKADGGTAYLSKSLVLIPIAIAAVMGIHGMGEGWDFASVAASATTGNLVSAFGGWNAVISYPLHKFFEASIIAIAYTCYVSRTDLAKKAAWHIPVLGLFFGLTSVIGSALGYYISVDTTYFYAFGVTAAFYATFRLVEASNQNFKIGITAPTFLGGKRFLALGVGFFLLYTAALFH